MEIVTKLFKRELLGKLQSTEVTVLMLEQAPINAGVIKA